MSRNDLLYRVLRFAVWLVPLLPTRVAYALACTAGNLAYLLVAPARRALADNLAHVPGLQPGTPAFRRLVRQAFQNNAKNWMDTLRIARLSREEILDLVRIDGWEYIEQALAQGTGIILVGMHLGNIDLVGQALVARGVKLTIPVERMQPPQLFEFVTQQRASKGLNVVPLERAPREMVKALRRGEMVAIVGDRNLAGKGVAVPFFGELTTLPRSPAVLARHSGAPIVVGVGIRTPEDRFQGYVTPPIPVTWTGDAERDIEVTTRHIAAAMESFITRFPDQWLVFAPIWRNGISPAVTIERTGAAV